MDVGWVEVGRVWSRELGLGLEQGGERGWCWRRRERAPGEIWGAPSGHIFYNVLRGGGSAVVAVVAVSSRLLTSSPLTAFPLSSSPLTAFPLSSPLLPSPHLPSSLLPFPLLPSPLSSSSLSPSSLSPLLSSSPLSSSSLSPSVTFLFNFTSFFAFYPFDVTPSLFFPNSGRDDPLPHSTPPFLHPKRDPLPLPHLLSLLFISRFHPSSLQPI
ncbi:hypothetical protein Pcinc_015538 [Petrolisthes cinctipes]|uniref:Uncharacterized protein n=1 Tax=Petrolisthes cinctipes TaxID=88211 RepID=A0AAE1FSU3_PETCI|nr:hypothetical protein Pcinc_015538 [Petrolisthes cinctipes]